MKILVTGGAGYIGSHTIIELVAAGYTPVIYDNLTNATEKSIDRLQQITQEKIEFICGDIRDLASLNLVFAAHNFQAVIHFAGLKSVAESVADPIDYYENNVFGSIQLLKAMELNNVKRIIFSSSATVYGDPQSLPIKETMGTGSPKNPYGDSKLMIENILRSIAVKDGLWSIMILRYFNPVGAHQSGLIGEDPKGRPNNIMPLITQTAAKKRQKIQIYGGDYDTHDGTGVRDYIHVVDLAKGHLKALTKTNKSRGLWTVNLGTGIGFSVLDLINTFESVSRKKIPYEVVGRRKGDVASCYADIQYAKAILNWEAQYGLPQMCEDAWRWETTNTSGV